jgi:homogentisate 1,2-dioxygenase
VATDTIDIDFSKDRILTRAAAGTITFTGANYAAGRSATVRIVAGDANRSLLFPAAWTFLSIKPTTLPATKTGVLTVTAFGTAPGDVVAAWGDQL